MTSFCGLLREKQQEKCLRSGVVILCWIICVEGRYLVPEGSELREWRQWGEKKKCGEEVEVVHGEQEVGEEEECLN